MGGRITIDSATLFNKGLEVIEAHHLFGTPYEQIDVVVHPQSIVHGMVSLNDGASLAHLGHPDMRVPISYALHHPERADVPVPTLDLAAVGSLEFEAPDEEAFPCLRLAREAAMAGGTAPCVLNAADEVAVHAFLNGDLPFTGIPRVIEDTLEAVPRPAAARLLEPRRGRHRGAPPRRRGRGMTLVSIILAAAGFMALVVLHEMGHFFAAKAVGMRVEKFSLFFPPNLISRKRGETEYAIGAIPLGGYVKITGMNPSEDLPDEVRTRAYYSQPVWKRIVVIAAGPAVNLVVAFLLMFVFFAAIGAETEPKRAEVDVVEKTYPAAGQLRPGDKILAVDGKRGQLAHAVAADLLAQVRRARRRRPRCKATEPANLLIERGGERKRVRAHPDLRPAGRRRPAWASATRPGPRQTLPPGQGVHAHVRPVHLHHRPDAQPARAAVRRREAQGDLRRGGLLRGHPADDPPGHRRGGGDPGGHLALAGDREPVPVPAAGRRAHLLGPGGAGPPQARLLPR